MFLHILPNVDHSRNYINFINEKLDKNEHIFVLTGDSALKNVNIINNSNILFIKNSNTTVFSKILLRFQYLILMFRMMKAQKVILHGLFNDHLVKYLSLFPFLLKKCYWAMWGGDFYFPEEQSQTTHFVIKNMGHCITLIPGDFQYLIDNYGCKKEQHYQSSCFMYLSNIYNDKKCIVETHRSSIIKIMIGNSADSTNNHKEILDKLSLSIANDKNCLIYAPLSYGDNEHALEVAKHGTKLFGNKFIPMFDYIKLEEYNKWLSSIDIAIFNHDRQQGLGNITTLLCMGKKVFIKDTISVWEFFKGKGFHIYNSNSNLLDITRLSENEKQENISNIKKYFSIDAYLENQKQLFRS